ncbi:DNA-directed RNA polymerase sigma-70 factor [Actinocatenispora thailandica]|uniref:DNA-directed RNA polymerase sigma-70 factor n=1 Tax=Actinocatenispora thailandica TaxID=227318 RepID=A0A7R7I020_9ACTN|nr:SigE family RNA polymerase sigma factor [Actinocatenispora thailandica]BCJ38868.1 DNA-directed RNA polymerase sigma-70 factor [Actinocatenispora thailandica]
MRVDWEHEYVEYVRVRLPLLRRTAYQLVGDGQRADDVVAQTLTDLYVRWRRARRADHLDAYVRRMLINTFLSDKRRAWSRVRLLAELPDRPAPAGDRIEDRDLVRQGLLAVPPRQRAVLVLRYLHDLPVTEVADLLGCSTGTVKSQAARGLATLRRALGVAAPAAAERTIR